MPPAISIITATYNRSNVLRLTIESVLRSAFSDWEMIVVGDACTDDTEAVICSFHDSRLRFINFAKHHGEQSRANNEGVAMARGRYIAFLNHDDFWTPDHLGLTVAELEKGAVPFVHTLGLAIPAAGLPQLFGATRKGYYEPTTFVPASSWVLRRDLMQRVGAWRPAQSLFLAPSVDWLYRAWKARIAMQTIPQVTVVCVLSGGRAGSYAQRQCAENERWASSLRDEPEFLLKQLTSIAAHATVNDLAVGRHLVRAAKNVVLRLTLAAGIHPALPRALMFGGRGGFVDSLRKTRGLPPLPRPEVTS